MSLKNNWIFLAIIVLYNLSCSNESEYAPIEANQSMINLPDVVYIYVDIEIPIHLSTNVLIGQGQNAAIDNDNTPSTNPTTNDGAKLGRVLFYDKNLSANGTIACASCHLQANSFSDSDILSLGIEGGTTRRHSMSLVNARWFGWGRFFWDERAATLEE